MNLRDGTSLAELLKNHPQGVFDWRTVANITRQITAALEMRRQAGTAYGGINPSNVLVGEDGNITLREIPPQQSESRDALLYHSPQQATSGAASPEDDVYSLGATLYELLTSEPPFNAKTKSELLEQIQKAIPEPIPTRLEASGRENVVPGVFRMIIDRCLQKEPSERPQLVEIERLLPREATPAPKKPRESLDWTPDSRNSELRPQVHETHPVPRRLKVAGLILLGIVAWITLGPTWSTIEKAGAILLLMLLAIPAAIALAKTANDG